MKETKHELTAFQQTKVAELLGQMKQLQITLNYMLSYVVDEAGLPTAKTGYQLTDDGKFLIGQVEKIEE